MLNFVNCRIIRKQGITDIALCMLNSTVRETIDRTATCYSRTEVQWLNVQRENSEKAGKFQNQLKGIALPY